MVLTIDVGNTNIVIGGFSDEKLLFVVRIATDALRTEDEYAVKIRSILALHEVEKAAVRGAIISSVVPPLNTTLRRAIRMIYGVDALMVGPGIKTGINISCDDPSSVGADIICGLVAANYLYGSPALVIDLGTATKMMLLDKNGAFIGASIAPGVRIAANALSSGTAQLPQISLEAPHSVIAKNTIDCMRAGVVLGNAAMIDGMIDRFCQASGEELRVIATGGLASVVIPHCIHAIQTDSELVLKGLYILYKKNAPGASSQV